MKYSEQPINPVPYQNDFGTIQHDIYFGLTKREYFAIQAMQGQLSNASESDVGSTYVLEKLGLPRETQYSFDDHYPKYVAKISLMYADALLAELSRESGQ